MTPQQERESIYKLPVIYGECYGSVSLRPPPPLDMACYPASLLLRVELGRFAHAEVFINRDGLEELARAITGYLKDYPL